MEEEQSIIQSKLNAYGNILKQLENIELERDAGLIEEEQFKEKSATRRACLAAIAELNAGTDVSDARYAELLEEARVAIAEPPTLYSNRADIDYLLMIGGE